MSDPVWRWVSEAVVLAIHDEQIAQHGGAGGVRDMDVVRSALDRPRNLAAYGAPDVADLAAAYAFGIARGHGFVDGNKRTAFVVASLFLLDHGYELIASDADAVGAMLTLAAGDTETTELSQWLRDKICPIEQA